MFCESGVYPFLLKNCKTVHRYCFAKRMYSSPTLEIILVANVRSLLKWIHYPVLAKCANFIWIHFARKVHSNLELSRVVECAKSVLQKGGQSVNHKKYWLLGERGGGVMTGGGGGAKLININNRILCMGCAGRGWLIVLNIGTELPEGGHLQGLRTVACDQEHCTTPTTPSFFWADGLQGKHEFVHISRKYLLYPLIKVQV